ncbi:MAG: hypothetical protein KC731_20580 [Myxococcales bacterium]|nr:hypothetical protein [Myxococcales bacterium]
MVLATVLPIGCAPHMKVPADLDDAVVLDVAGRTPDRFAGDELSFGSYHADSVSRGYTSSFVDRDFFGKALDEIRSYPEDDSFSYRLSDGEHDFHAVCTAAPQRTEMPGFTSTTTHHLQCVCAAKEPQRVVQLSLAGEDDVLRGVLSQPSASYSVAGTRDLAGTALPAQNATGYLISSRTRLVAAIDVLEEGRIWVDPSLPSHETDALACAAVALMLHH